MFHTLVSQTALSSRIGSSGYFVAALAVTVKLKMNKRRMEYCFIIDYFWRMQEAKWLPASGLTLSFNVINAYAIGDDTRNIKLRFFAAVNVPAFYS